MFVAYTLGRARRAPVKGGCRRFNEDLNRHWWSEPTRGGSSPASWDRAVPEMLFLGIGFAFKLLNRLASRLTLEKDGQGCELENDGKRDQGRY